MHQQCVTIFGQKNVQAAKTENIETKILFVVVQIRLL